MNKLTIKQTALLHHCCMCSCRKSRRITED